MSADGRMGEPLDLSCGACSVDVSSEDEAARTGGRSHVFLLVRGEMLEDGSVTGVVMTGPEARELAWRLRHAASRVTRR